MLGNSGDRCGTPGFWRRQKIRGRISGAVLGDGDTMKVEELEQPAWFGRFVGLCSFDDQEGDVYIGPLITE
jgi:hypothetical protein